MLTIARSELIMLARNRLVAMLAIVTPLAFGLIALLNADLYGGGGLVAGMQVIGMITLGTYATAATTLAARRQTLYLKRLRGGVIGDGGIIGGLVGPIVAMSVVQVLVVTGALAATSDWPANPLLVVAAVLAGQAMFVGLALATAGVTTSPEHAQVTTLPVLAVSIAAAIWVAFTGFEELAAVKRLIPGGALMEWVMLAWQGGDLSSLPWAILPTLGWAVVAGIAAKVMFTWEPRT